MLRERLADCDALPPALAFWLEFVAAAAAA